MGMGDGEARFGGRTNTKRAGVQRTNLGDLFNPTLACKADYLD
jgi:hypothetical protein